ncbi:hypothetical protein BDQ17DRAFT_1436343 [Cyathus striatus]|nr:hypothetical protein BDQ17DRAFT_1436343 [Cyathus striatus]
MSMGSPAVTALTMWIVYMGVGVQGVASSIANANAHTNAAFSGIASSLRQILLKIEGGENTSLPPSPALFTGNKRDLQGIMTRDGDGLGGRNDIEDDEELLLEIMDSLMHDTSLTESPSPEPEPVIGRLGALVKEEDGEQRMGEAEGDTTTPPPPPPYLHPSAHLLDFPPGTLTLAELCKDGLQFPGLREQ